jgi:hypothetical protein
MRGTSLFVMSVARRAGVLLLVAALVLALGATLAAGKKHKKRKGKAWASKITLVHPAPTEFTGTVSSKLDACRNRRLVTVYYTDPVTGQTQPLSVQRTGGDGRYEVSLPAPAYAGSYQAQVSEQRIRAHKAPQTCKADLSPVISV